MRLRIEFVSSTQFVSCWRKRGLHLLIVWDHTELEQRRQTLANRDWSVNTSPLKWLSARGVRSFLHVLVAWLVMLSYDRVVYNPIVETMMWGWFTKKKVEKWTRRTSQEGLKNLISTPIERKKKEELKRKKTDGEERFENRWSKWMSTVGYPGCVRYRDVRLSGFR